MQNSLVPSNMPRVICVCALASEAKPLREHFAMRQINFPGPGQLYADKQQQVLCLVTGVGALKMAMSIAANHRYHDLGQHCVYLNIGIAGSGEHALGDCVMVNKIIDTVTQKNYYPWQFKTALVKASCYCVSQYAPGYYPAGLIDMESSGFFQAVQAVVSQEQALLVKVVSDTQTQHIEQLNKAVVAELITAQLPAYQDLITYALSLSERLCQQQITIDLSPWLARWHFSHYQQHQLKHLLRRWSVHGREDALAMAASSKSATSVLQALTDALAQQVYRWD